MRAPMLVVTAAILLLGTSPATAEDRPVAGVKLRVVRTGAGAERLLFVSRDGLSLFPSAGSADDPAGGTPGGATVELFSSSTSGSVAFSAPRDVQDPGWRADAHRYRFRHAAAADAASALSRITIGAAGGIRIVGQRAGLPLTGDEGSVAIRLTLGGIRYCALFGPETVTRDDPGVFDARRAPAAASTDCSDATLEQMPAATCGNGVIDSASESCDGADLGICGDAGVSCGHPGFSNECTCCSRNGELVSVVGCCNPASVAISSPAGSGFCVPLRCDAPFTCGSGSECLPDGSCCGHAGNPCQFTLTGTALQPCCDGQVCGRPDQSGFLLVCCAPAASSCAQDQDCCSQSCSGAGVCD